MIQTARHGIDDRVEQVLAVSDIHGHLRALEGFERLAVASNRNCQIVFNGDLFGGGPWPVEMVEWVRTHAGELATSGNHDEIESEAAKEDEPAYTEAGAYQRLNAEQREYVRSRPHRLELLWRGKRIILMHGHVTPTGGQGSWLARPDEQVANFADPRADLFITSHTHCPFVREYNGTIFANTGSLSVLILGVAGEEGLHVQSGKPEIGPDEDLRSSFLAINESSGKLHVEIVRFDYDREAALADLERAGQPNMEFFRRWFTEGIVVPRRTARRT